MLHYITGKGGVGKSTFAASLALKLAQEKQPVLLIEVQGSGRSLQLVGLNSNPFANTAVPEQELLWAARILPRDTFHQYFELLLSLGKENSGLAQVTAGLRSRVVDMILENKVVSAFVDTCPGLEPAVLMGKLHWEATRGHTPEMNSPWAHVVVDAPATGHGIMLFKSTIALTEVFGAGVIFKQAKEIRDFVSNPTTSSVYVVSTPEELPLAEARDIEKELLKMGIPLRARVVNRCRSPELEQSIDLYKLDENWKREMEFERDARQEQEELIRDFKYQSKVPLWRLPELNKARPFEMPPQLAHVIEAESEANS